jgi:hypothetical protein
MVFPPQNTMAVTIVFILVVLHNSYTVTIYCNSFSPLSLSHTCCGEFCKVCVILFHDFVFINFVIVIIYFYFFKWDGFLLH